MCLREILLCFTAAASLLKGEGIWDTLFYLAILSVPSKNDRTFVQHRLMCIKLFVQLMDKKSWNRTLHGGVYCPWPCSVWLPLTGTSISIRNIAMLHNTYGLSQSYVCHVISPLFERTCIPLAPSTLKEKGDDNQISFLWHLQDRREVKGRIRTPLPPL